MAASKDKSGTETEAKEVAATIVKGDPNSIKVVGKTARNQEIKVRGDFDMTGFVTSAAHKESEEWAKVHVDRRMYRSDFCAQFGGVQGYLLKTEVMKSEAAKNEKNPDGLFTAAIMRLTAPAPVCDDNGNVSRAEIGEDVIVVLTHTIAKLEEFDRDPKFCAEVQIIPTSKEVLARSGHNLWRYDVSLRLDKIPRGNVDAAAMFFAPTETKALGESTVVKPAPETKQAQPATAS